MLLHICDVDVCSRLLHHQAIILVSLPRVLGIMSVSDAKIWDIHPKNNNIGNADYNIDFTANNHFWNSLMLLNVYLYTMGVLDTKIWGIPPTIYDYIWLGMPTVVYCTANDQFWSSLVIKCASYILLLILVFVFYLHTKSDRNKKWKWTTKNGNSLSGNRPF